MGLIRKIVPQTDIDAARQMRASGLHWKGISRRTGHSVETLRRRLDPSYDRAMREKYQTRSYAPRSCASLERIPSARPMTEAQLKAYRASIPDDTRDNTGRLLGDPIPGHHRRFA